LKQLLASIKLVAEVKLFASQGGGYRATLLGTSLSEVAGIQYNVAKDSSDIVKNLAVVAQGAATTKKTGVTCLNV
jgi:hypothetical protein